MAGLVLAVTVSVAAAQVSAPKPLPALLSAEQRSLYDRAFDAADTGKWDEARQIARSARDPLGEKIVRWMQLQQPRSGAPFEDIAGFIDANPDWPNLDALMRRAEEALIDRTDDSVVLAWFALRGPTTSDGAMRYIEALQRAGERQKALQLIKNTWLNFGFGAVQEAQFLKRYKQHLSAHDHAQRLDRLIWDGKREEAQRMLPRVDGDQRAVADARLKLAAQSSGVDSALKKVPDHLTNDAGLLFERMRWRRRKKQYEAALDILKQPPKDLERPEIWWNERAFLARRAISSGRMQEAYAIVSNHRLTGGAGLTEAEFLAGWIMLRFRNEPEGALRHFTRLYEAARFPVTRARGAYWAGRAASAAGDKEAAKTWFSRAGGFGTTFYGQTALAALEPGERPEFALSVPVTDAERAAFEKTELVRAVRLLHESKQPKRMKPFLTRLALNAKTPAQHALVSELAIRLERPDLAVSVAKRSAQVASVSIPDHGWPMMSLPGGELPERALVFSTIRQESAFEADALSHAGARGLMQLIPPTARAVAKQLSLPVDKIEQRLVSDPHFNIRLGRTYLADLIDDYDGSYVLAIAAYNAGPGRVRQWIRDNGDPRKSNIDVIDWIELIPIDETRNYLHRVLENLQVYRQRLGSRTQLAQNIDQDLRRSRTSANGQQ